jgi:hypothetical protein
MKGIGCDLFYLLAWGSEETIQISIWSGTLVRVSPCRSEFTETVRRQKLAPPTRRIHKRDCRNRVMLQSTRVECKSTTEA